MTPGFSTLTIPVRTGDGRNVVLIEPVAFTRKNGEVITIPAGATSDGASTPRELWPTVPPFGKYWLAAVLHDFLYRSTQRPKPECDTILLEAMETLGVLRMEADAIYAGVHAFGSAAFRHDRAGEGIIA